MGTRSSPEIAQRFALGTSQKEKIAAKTHSQNVELCLQFDWLVGIQPNGPGDFQMSVKL